ncbi:translation initiation factor IF-2-like [Orcinus orca]|uniref:translation initiation factor IF-2-like n=1 Tax=Orcinus orca TaxID=9733 RepID=UPI00211361C2|nr:translation initiation factor IF-2-like [Orcinus orca]
MGDCRTLIEAEYRACWGKSAITSEVPLSPHQSTFKPAKGIFHAYKRQFICPVQHSTPEGGKLSCFGQDPTVSLCALNLDQAKHAPRGRRRGEREVAAPPLPRHRHPPRPAQERAAAGWRERGSTPRAAQRRPPAARTPRSTPERPRRAACTLRPPRTGHLPPRGRLRAHPAPRAHLSAAPPAPGSGGRPAPPRASLSRPSDSPPSFSSLQSSRAGPRGLAPAVGGKRAGPGGRGASGAAPARRRGKGEGEGEEGAGSLGGVIPSDPSLPAVAAPGDSCAGFPPRRWPLCLSLPATPLASPPAAKSSGSGVRLLRFKSCSTA